MSTGPELTSLVVHNYHKKILELTHHVMDSLSMRERDVSTLTLGVKKERIPEFKKRLREFRKELLELASTDDEPEEVVQLNLQFFPVTVKVTEE